MRSRGEVASPLGVVKEEVVVLVVLVRWHRRVVGAAVGRAIDDEIPGAVEACVLQTYLLPTPAHELLTAH